MGYRIEFAVGGGVLRATVSGHSAAMAGAIARAIGDEARSHSVRQVMIDVRRLHDRLGRLRALLTAERPPERIAVVDSWKNDCHYVFAEIAAQALGCELRRFDDQAAALDWLHSPAA